MAKYILGEKYYYKPVHEAEKYEYLGELLGIEYEIGTYDATYAYLTFDKKRTVLIEYIAGTFKETNEKCIFTENEYKSERPKLSTLPYPLDNKEFINMSDKELVRIMSDSFNDYMTKIKFNTDLLPSYAFQLPYLKEYKLTGIPFSVNFVEKHKRTTLVWKGSFNRFETTKSEAHDEKFDYLYGFLMAYFKRVHRDMSKTQLKKYLNAIVYPMTKKEQTAFLQGVFYENCGLGFKEAKEYLEKIKVKK